MVSRVSSFPKRYVLPAALSAVLTSSLILLSCDIQPKHLKTPRGIILISIDTLRADHLSCYGYERLTSPFIDDLANRGTLFENAIVQLPSTLVSHTSIFTSLYPAEHGVYPDAEQSADPQKVLSEEISTLPEVLRQNGFVTGGSTEGGWVSRHYGFSRGFDEFSDEAGGQPDDIEVTFGRGLEFLKNLKKKDHFFLFLHTYEVHDPYSPPEPYPSLYWKNSPLDTFPPTGMNFLKYNWGRLDMSGSARDYYEALYDAGINYMDDVFRDFYESVASLGLLEDTVWVFTSDHGEEFLEHGMMVHQQIYPETLHVPLIIVHPDAPGGQRVSSLVESVDIAPTLYELVGIPIPPSLSGRSFASNLLQPRLVHREFAYAEAHVTKDRTVFRRSDDETYQLIQFRPKPGEDGGVWMTHELSFDHMGPSLSFRVISYKSPRTLHVSVNGQHLRSIVVDPGVSPWTAVKLDISSTEGKKRITFSSETCDTPTEPFNVPCLSFKILDLDLKRVEVYNLTRDSGATHDLSRVETTVGRDLLGRLDLIDWKKAAEPDSADIPEDVRKRLKALGYIQ